jgi:hypothetical protein
MAHLFSSNLHLLSIFYQTLLSIVFIKDVIFEMPLWIFFKRNKDLEQIKIYKIR